MLDLTMYEVFWWNQRSSAQLPNPLVSFSFDIYYTPILETIFALCHSIKSWYDLNEKNLTLIHCPVGQANTGIVIACLLKYIGAFEHAAHAYDFYCSKRYCYSPSAQS